MRYKSCPVDSGHLSFFLAINLRVNVIENETDAILQPFLPYFQVIMHFPNVSNKSISLIKEIYWGCSSADDKLRCLLYCRQVSILVWSRDSVNLYFIWGILVGVNLSTHTYAHTRLQLNKFHTKRKWHCRAWRLLFLLLFWKSDEQPDCNINRLICYIWLKWIKPLAN